LVSRHAKMAAYQKQNINSGDDSQLKMLQKLELTREMHFELIAYCESKNIKFLSTAFDLESLDFLNELNLDLFKVPSGEITNLPYLRKVGSFGKQVILSSGMADMKEIEAAANALLKAGAHSISVLHCNTEYPTPMKDVNLNAMLTIGRELNVQTGYSDHTAGIEIPIAAVALGASIIEKHFTLDKKMAGPDHKASLEPEELCSMVAAIRNIELAMGDGVKKASESEEKNKAVARKSIVASKNIKEGEIFSEDNITTKRPGDGVSPMLWDSVIGTKAKKSYNEDDLI